MKKPFETTSHHKQILITLFFTTLLVGCGEGIIPPSGPKELQFLPLNDTGVNYTIDGQNSTATETSSGSVEFVGNPLIYTNTPSDFSPGEINVNFGEAPNYPGQDGAHGRDTNPANNGPFDGRLGFSFVKLDRFTGAELNPDATEFGCVKDRVTGLTWENKTENPSNELSGYNALHDSLAQHTWYDPNPATNGGHPGQRASDSACNIQYDTFTFTQAVNTENLCGISNWRVPTTEEMRSLVDYSVKNGNASKPMMDSNYFRFTAQALHRWTSQTNGSNTRRAYGFHFHEGRMQGHSKHCTLAAFDASGNPVSGNQNSYHNSTFLVSGVYTR